MTDISTHESIIIDAPIDRVWRALTDPEWIKQWFFGVDTETDWKKGSPMVHRGEYQGKPYEDKGTILEIDPQRCWCTVTGVPPRVCRTLRRTTNRCLGSYPTMTQEPSLSLLSRTWPRRRPNQSPSRTGGWF